MNHKPEFSDFDSNAFLDALAKVIIDHQPKNSILNPARCHDLFLAKEAFDALLAENCAAPSIVQYHPTFCSGALIAELDSWEVSDFTAFQVLLAKADNFEIYPLTNGNMRIAFMFHHLMLPFESCRR